MNYPKAYVLQHHKYGTYIGAKNSTYCSDLRNLERYENDKEHHGNWAAIFFKDNIEDAKMWTNLKKVKKFLNKDAAKYFFVIGSDQTVIPAINLFELIL